MRSPTNNTLSCLKSPDQTNHPSVRPQESGEDGRSRSELLQELQEVKGDAASTKEELNCYRELSHKLQEEIEVQTAPHVTAEDRVS